MSDFNQIDAKAAAYTELSAEEARHLYARWVKLGLEYDCLRAELERAQAEVERLKDQNSSLAMRHGGKNAGHVYGPTNCEACGQLTESYYLIGQSQLCMACFDAFPAAMNEIRSRLEACRARNGKLRSLLEKGDQSDCDCGFAGAKEWHTCDFHAELKQTLAQTEEQAGREWAAMREALERIADVTPPSGRTSSLGDWELRQIARDALALAKVDASREGKS